MRNVDIKILSEDLVPRDIEANIVSEHYFTAEDGVIGVSFKNKSTEACPSVLRLVTFCVLVLRNGFTVTGESVREVDDDLSRKIAREQAEQRLWILMEYAFHTTSKGEA